MEPTMAIRVVPDKNYKFKSKIRYQPTPQEISELKERKVLDQRSLGEIANEYADQNWQSEPQFALAFSHGFLKAKEMINKFLYLKQLGLFNSTTFIFEFEEFDQIGKEE